MNLKQLREESFDITKGGTIGETLQYMMFDSWKHFTEPDDGDHLVVMTEEFLKFIEPVRKSPTLRIHKCKSHPSSWAMLAGREFLAIVDEEDEEEKIVDAYMICMN